MKNLSFPGLPRVLIVDDEDGVREGLRTLLQTEGLHVETAGTAEEGLHGGANVVHVSTEPMTGAMHVPGLERTGFDQLGDVATHHSQRDQAASQRA